MLNSFLQFLEHHTSDSLIIAATNLMHILDPALFRRFDAALRYELPSDEEVPPVIKNRLSTFGTNRLSWGTIVDAARGLSHADIVRAAEAAAREAVLSHRQSIHTDELIAALRERTAARPGQEK